MRRYLLHDLLDKLEEMLGPDRSGSAGLDAADCDPGPEASQHKHRGDRYT
jgi:hypothetical protein